MRLKPRHLLKNNNPTNSPQVGRFYTTPQRPQPRAAHPGRRKADAARTPLRRTCAATPAARPPAPYLSGGSSSSVSLPRFTLPGATPDSLSRRPVGRDVARSLTSLRRVPSRRLAGTFERRAKGG
ncbi:Hypothetical predicted protein [Podarcis lilfordi]|uniref:Uncharacterized protein n=1 Tax=Podarcis lilfordi TaxID=74358 RepID=A0AA35JXI0_9SAUR|nr:Hypothetical predicted protein [Podarcis lilfordi]